MRIEIDGEPKYICPFLTAHDIEQRFDCTYIGRSKKGTMRFTRNLNEPNA